MWNRNLESLTSQFHETRIPDQPHRPGTIQDESFLHSISFLQILPIRTREKVIRQFHSVSFPYGSSIVANNRKSAVLFVLGSGRVRAVSNNRLGQETTASMLEPGNFFGEIGLAHLPSRPITFQTCDHVQAFAIDTHILKDLFVTHPQLEAFFRRYTHQVEIHHFLRLETLFSHMPPSILSKLGTYLRPLPVRANQLVIKRGEKPGSVYVVREGKFQMFCDEENGWEETRDMSPGDVFGEVAPCRKTPRTTNVRAVTDGVCLALDLETFLDLLHQAPPFKWQIDMIMGSHGWVSH